VELGKKTNEQRENKRDKPKNRLLTIQNYLIVTKGEVSRGMGEIGEGGD